MSIHSLVFAFAALVASAQGVSSEENLDPLRMIEIEKLVIQVPSDTAGELDGLSDESLAERNRLHDEKAKRREEEIRTRTDLTPYLIELLNRYWQQGEWEGLESILRAMAIRADLPVGKVSDVKTAMREMLEGRSGKGLPFRLAYLIGGVDVLASHPSIESEDIICGVLIHLDNSLGVPLKISAANALAKVGTARSLPFLERSRKWMSEFSAASGRTGFETKLIEGAITAVRARATESRSVDGPTYNKPQSAPHQSLPPSGRGNVGKQPWLVWAVVILAAIGLLWLVLKKRK